MPQLGQGPLSLVKNLTRSTTLPDFQWQVAELITRLEDYLNARVDIFLIGSKGPEGKKRRPSFKKGDIVFDLTKTPGVATLQQWDGEKLITFNLANFEGYINLLTQGNGSGNNPTLYLRSDGADGWTLDTPTRLDTQDINATEDIPAFSLVTMSGKVADSANTVHFNHVIGISTVVVLNGFINTVVTQGEVENPLWSWTNNDRLYLNGTTLNTISPSTGFSQLMAIARSATKIFVRLERPVFL